MADCDGTHPSTVMLAVRADGSFLVTRRAKPGYGYGKWSAPGGRIERGESWQDASKRELAEEAGLSVGEALLLTVTTTGLPEAADGELGWLVVWAMGRCTASPSQKVVLNDEASEYAWATCGDLWRYDMWKPHWTPMLDYYGGTTNLDKHLKGMWE